MANLAACVFSMAVAPAVSHAANAAFEIPVMIMPGQYGASGGASALVQDIKPAFVATLTEDVTPPEGDVIKAGELLFAGAVGQGVMYCASPQRPRLPLIGSNSSLYAVCFRDTANKGIFDQVASQYQAPDRANTIVEAGFSPKMHWMAGQFPYRKLPLEEAPSIRIEIKGSGFSGLLTGGKKMLVDPTICFPPTMHHANNNKDPDRPFCGIAHFDRRKPLDSYGTRLNPTDGGPPKRYSNGPIEIDFAFAADGSAKTNVLHTLPEGLGALRVFAQMHSGPYGSVLDNTVFLIQPLTAEGAIK